MADLPKSFKVVAGLSIAWMAIGLLMFVLDLSATAEQIAALPPEQQTIRAMRPTALMVVFGISTVVGLLGAIGLLLRKRWCVPMLLTSFLAVVVQFGWSVFGLPTMELMGPSAAILPAVVAALGFAILRYAQKAQANGWLA